MAQFNVILKGRDLKVESVAYIWKFFNGNVNLLGKVDDGSDGFG